MQQTVCNCQCGTRIDLDQQLLEQRQMWKQKYVTLQRQMGKDIGQMKQTIYAQCSNIMVVMHQNQQQQFQQKEKQQAKLMNKKNSQIQSLTSKVINLETNLKVFNREKQIQQNRHRQVEEQLKEKENLIILLKNQSMRSERDWTQKNQEDMNAFRKKVAINNRQLIEKLETQNDHLKHKLKDFEKKYQILIPEVQKLKATLNQKNSAIQNIQQKLQKLRRDNDKTISSLSLQKQQIEKIHSKCRQQIIKLQQKLGQQQIQIKNHKKFKTQIKVQPIYIDRPIEVEKIVQKIVPVQKIVKEYIQPAEYHDIVLEEQNKKLKLENDKMLRQLHNWQKKLKQTNSDYESVISQYKGNIQKYKHERQNLGKRIAQLTKQLDIVYNVTAKNKSAVCNQTPQMIKVYVKNDGQSEYYSNTTNATSPRGILGSPRLRTGQRANSRSRQLSNSLNKQVKWK